MLKEKIFGVYVHSSPETLNNKKVTLLSVIETLIGVLIYWSIAFVYDTHAHLIISVLVAPFLLLRSDKSIKYGLNLLYRYKKSKIDVFSEASPFYVPLMIAFAVFVCVKTSDYFENINKFYLVVEFFLILPICVTFLSFKEFDNSLRVRLEEQKFRIKNRFIRKCYKKYSQYLNYVFGILIALVTVCGPGAGFLLRIFFIRVLSTIRYSVYGARNFSENWKRVIFFEDSKTKLEIIPGINESSKLDDLTYLGIKNKYVTEESTENKISNSFFIVIVFIPSVMYRLSLKSTFWFYFPLLWVATKIKSMPKYPFTNDVEVSDYLINSYKTPWATFSFISSFLLVVMSLVFYFFSIDGVSSFLSNDAYKELNFSWKFFLYFDYSDYVSNLFIWQFFELVAALSTIVIYFMTGGVYYSYEKNGIVNNKKIFILSVVFTYVKNISVPFYIIIALFFVLNSYLSTLGLNGPWESLQQLTYWSDTKISEIYKP